MCGISAVLTKKNADETDDNAATIVIQALSQLQNRGYDSVGIGFIDENNIVVRRTTTLTQIKEARCRVCIGHTRWATHGARTLNNAHPHVSFDGMFSLVHNGIIENHGELKQRLVDVYGRQIFKSETDSEVIAHLLSHSFAQTDVASNDIKTQVIHNIQKVCQQLSGTYGLAILCKDIDDAIFMVRNGSPLLVGQNSKYVFAASEMSGFDGQVTHFTSIPSECVTVMQACGEHIHMAYTEKNDRVLVHHKCTNYGAFSPDPYPHWLLKEILEQPLTLMQSINNGARIYGNKINLGGLHAIKESVRNVQHIVLIGCGTSMYACKTASYYFTKCVPHAHVSVFDAAEYNQMLKIINSNTLFIVCSQSGETMDIIKAIDEIRKSSFSYHIVGIVNVVNSQISQMVDCGVYLNVGREVSVASTKSYVSSLLVFFMIAEWMRGVIVNRTDTICLDNIHKLMLQIQMQTNQHISKLNTFDWSVTKLYDSYGLCNINQPSLFILGRGRFEAVAHECALKFKEICYIHAEGCHAGSLKHGPFALLKKGFPVILFIDRENRDKMLNTYQELIAREAYVMVLTDLNYHDNTPCENVVYLPHNGSLPEILFANMIQMFAYCISVYNGNNPDRPRNLAKVVTVE